MANEENSIMSDSKFPPFIAEIIRLRHLVKHFGFMATNKKSVGGTYTIEDVGEIVQRHDQPETQEEKRWIRPVMSMRGGEWADEAIARLPTLNEQLRVSDATVTITNNGSTVGFNAEEAWCKYVGADGNGNDIWHLCIPSSMKRPGICSSVSHRGEFCIFCWDLDVAKHGFGVGHFDDTFGTVIQIKWPLDYELLGQYIFPQEPFYATPHLARVAITPLVSDYRFEAFISIPPK